MVGVVILFFVVNRIYRLNTIDKDLKKMMANGAIILDVSNRKGI